MIQANSGSLVPLDFHILDVAVLKYRLVLEYVDVALCPVRATNIMDDCQGVADSLQQVLSKPFARVCRG